MGAVFRVPIEHAELPPEGPNRVALVPGAERAIWQLDLSKPTVFVVGAERHGLPAEVVAVCDEVGRDPAGRGRRVAERGRGGDGCAL